MSAQAIIIALVLVLWILVVIFFKKRNRAIQELHLQTVLILNDNIQQHKCQIKQRQKGLMRYDLLRHNLNEALVVQTEIEI